MLSLKSTLYDKNGSVTILSGRYLVVRKLGSGNFGTVFLVKDFDDEKKFKAAKCIDCSDLEMDEAVGAVKEAQLLSNLRHPNVLCFIDSFLEKDYFYIVTEFCENGDLHNRLNWYRDRKKRITEDLILKWFVQLVSAAEYIHKRQILHRDIKARNIFLTKLDVLKIGDFGISRVLLHTYDMATTFTGTPYYMSPESLKHEGYDSKSDMWSIGCLLYEMCALEHAFQGQGLMGVMYKVVEGEAPNLPDRYSKELNTIFKNLLLKDPKKRASASTVIHMSYITQYLEKQAILDGDTDCNSTVKA